MISLHATRGANYWSRTPITQMDLNIGEYENISSADVPGFTQSLVAAMPGLRDHRCSIGEPGGFLIRLKRGTYCAHIVEHVALELQGMIGHNVGYGRTSLERLKRSRIAAVVRTNMTGERDSGECDPREAQR